MTVLTLETDITDITAAGFFSLGNRTVNRMGYGAMQHAGRAMFGRRRIAKRPSKGSTTSIPAIITVRM